MTVDTYFTQETDDFVLKNAKYYPERIPITHWQLRHFISSPEPDILYYASKRDIYALNTQTHIRTHITCLPFHARCTAAGHGYICVGGGDNGHFAIVTLNHTHTHAEALSWQQRRPPSVEVESAGQEIVNSISIHKLQGAEDSGLLDDVVAVITNNDKKIRIFSLTQHSQNTVLELPFPVNHATISPDGRMLVAVGDLQTAYVYERVELSSADSKVHKYVSADSVWEMAHEINLHVPRSVGTTGYFTTAWSPFGNLCAVASECGYVSVIDIHALATCKDAEDAIVVVMPSTRPENVHPHGAIPGAIRTMIFAPPPWDLLIWAEDQGKVCLADLRTGLRTKQVLNLDPDQDNYQRIDMGVSPLEKERRQQDPDAEREYIRNFRSYHTSSGDFTPPYDIDHELALAETVPLAETRSHARAIAGRMAEDSRREREILESIRTTTTRERINSNPMPRSIHYPELANDPRRSSAQQNALFTQDFPALARQGDELGSSSASTVPNTIQIMRDYMRERTSESSGSRSSTSLRPFALNPREQELDDALAAAATSTSAQQQAPTLSDRATLYQGDLTRSSASRLLNTLRASPHSTTGPSDTTIDPIDRRRRAALRARERAFASRELTALESARYHRMSAAATVGAGAMNGRGDFYDPGLGHRTAGLAMSRDGRVLWCASDRGIFEFEVNTWERMGSKAMEMK